PFGSLLGAAQLLNDPVRDLGRFGRVWPGFLLRRHRTIADAVVDLPPDVARLAAEEVGPKGIEAQARERFLFAVALQAVRLKKRPDRVGVDRLGLGRQAVPRGRRRGEQEEGRKSLDSHP